MDLFLSILKSVIYGVIEGITEWLPISSTGHMILAEQVLKFGYTEDFMEMCLFHFMDKCFKARKLLFRFCLIFFIHACKM